MRTSPVTFTLMEAGAAKYEACGINSTSVKSIVLGVFNSLSKCFILVRTAVVESTIFRENGTNFIKVSWAGTNCRFQQNSFGNGIKAYAHLDQKPELHKFV